MTLQDDLLCEESTACYSSHCKRCSRFWVSNCICAVLSQHLIALFMIRDRVKIATFPDYPGISDTEKLVDDSSSLVASMIVGSTNTFNNPTTYSVGCKTDKQDHTSSATFLLQKIARIYRSQHRWPHCENFLFSLSEILNTLMSTI